MIMKSYIADELANKVYHLTKALEQAKDIIENLEIQNEILVQALSNFNHKDIQQTELVSSDC